MSILARLCLLASIVASAWSATAITVIKPLPDQQIPRDHEVEVTAVILADLATLSSGTSTATISIGGGAAQTIGNPWLKATVLGDGSTPATLVRVTTSATAATAGQTVTVVMSIDDNDGDTDPNYTATITWIATEPSSAQQPMRPVFLPPLAGDDRAEVEVVRRQGATATVLSGGYSYVTTASEDDQVEHAVLWSFNGTTVTTIDVHAQLNAVKTSLGLDQLNESAISAINHVGQSAGTCDGNKTGFPSTPLAVAWLREADGTIRFLAALAEGALVNEGPEVTYLTENGWVLADTLTGAAVSTPTSNDPSGTTPPYRGKAFRFGSAAIDLHVAAASAAGAAANSSVSGASFARAGTGTALGVVSGVVYDPGIEAFVPYVRNAAGVTNVETTNVLNSDDFGAGWVTAAADQIVVEDSLHGKMYLAGWNNTGLLVNPTQIPTFFADAGNTNELYLKDTSEQTATSLELLIGTKAYGDEYRTWIQPADISGAPTFGARIFPEWLVPNSYLRQTSQYLWLNLESLDASGSDRVYGASGYGWSGNPKAVLLVDVARIIDAQPDLTIAYPKDGSSIPVGHQVPIVVKIETLPVLKGTTRLQIFFDDLNDATLEESLFDTTNPLDLAAGEWSIERKELSTLGHQYRIRAVLTFSDASQYQELSTVTAIASTPTYQLFELPLPPGAIAKSAEGKRILLDVANSNKVWVTGGADYPGNTTKPVYWTWQAGQSAQAFAIEVPATVGAVSGFSTLGGWGMDIGLVDNIPTILIGKAKSNVDGTDDWYLLAYRPTQTGNEWHVIGQFGFHIDPTADPLTSEPQFFANGDVYAEVITGTGELGSITYAHAAKRFTRTASTTTWSAGVTVTTPGAAAEFSAADDASGTRGVGLFKRNSDGIRRVFHQEGANAATELTGLPEHPALTNADLLTRVATVGGNPRFDFVRILPADDNNVRAFIRDGLAGPNIALQAYSTASEKTDLYAMNDDGDVGGEVALIGTDLLRATRWDPATGAATDLNFLVDPVRLIALGAGTTDRLELEEVFAMTPRVTGGLPIMSGGGGFWDPTANGGNGDWQEREYLLVPLAFLPANDIPVLAVIGQQSTVINTNLVLSVSATDGDVGDTLTFSATGATQGTVTVVGTTVTFTPTSNYSGTAGFTVIVDDGKGGTDSQTVSVIITGAGGGEATVVATDSTATEEGYNTATFTVTLDASAPVGGRLVTLAVGSGVGSASRGIDYVLRLNGDLLPVTGNLQVNIPQFSSTAVINVEPINDESPEGDETITLTLVSVGSNNSPTASSATATIERSDFDYFTLWAARKSVNNHPEQGEYGAINWHMEAAPGRVLTAATFTFPGGRVVPGMIENGTVADVGIKAFDQWDVSLATLQAGMPNGIYMVELVYTSGPNEIRTKAATFNWSGWPAYPTVSAPVHGSANVVLDGQQRVTAAWSGPALNFISIHSRNGPGININRDRFEIDRSLVNTVTSYLIPTQLMSNQPYVLEFMALSNDGQMGTITQTGFSTGSLPIFSTDSDNLAATPLGDLTTAVNLPLRHQPQTGPIVSGTRTISRESVVLPGSAGTLINAVKVVEVTNGGAQTEIRWFARSSDNSLYVLRESNNGSVVLDAVPYLIIPGGATVGTTWFSGVGYSETATDYAISRLVSTTATAPTANRATCSLIHVTAIADANQVFERTWSQPGFGTVEHSTSKPSDGIDYIPLVLSDPPVMAAITSLTINEDTGPSAPKSLSATDADTAGSALTWTILTNGTRGTASLGTATGGALPGDVSANTLTYTPTANQFGSDSVVVKVSDPEGNFSTQTLNITITGLNDAPSFTVGSSPIVVNEDSGTYGPTAWATAISSGPLEADSLTFTVTNDNNTLFSTQPAITTLGALTFVPANNANGSATVTVSLSDGSLSTTPVNVVITVTAINDAPTATLAVVSAVNEDAGAQAITGFVALIQPGGGGDETTQTVTTVLVGNDNPSLFDTLPALVANNSDYDLTYTPALNKNGSATVMVRLTDNGTPPVITDLPVTITVSPVNDAPVATAIPTISGAQTIGATLTATTGTWNDVIDQVSPTFTYAYQWQRASDNAGTGAVDIGGATASTYVLTGSDAWVRVRVIATDNGLPGPGVAGAISDSLWIRGVNAVPVITDNAPLVMLEDAVVAATRVLNATDVETSAASLVWSILTQGTKGTASVTSPGASATVSYTPSANAFGGDTVVVACDDGEGGISTVSVVITITAVNDVPTFSPPAGSLTVDASVAYSASWATEVSAGPGESAQFVTFGVMASDPEVFTVPPTISASGVLSFTPGPAGGSSDITVTLLDSGGTANGGVDTSAAVVRTITMQRTPVITGQPANQLKVVGGTASFIVVANGSPTPTYLWQRSNDVGATWNALGGATASTYTTPSLSSGDNAARFRCVVSNPAGSSTSSVALLIIGTVPTVSAPTNLSTGIGTIAQFSVSVTGDPAPGLLWQVFANSGSTWTDIPSATSTSLSVGPVVLGDSGKEYRCVASNALGTANSLAATLTVTAIAPSITLQPQSRSVVVGAMASFTIAAQGNPAPTYQWQRNTVDISSATTATYSLTTVQDDNNAVLRCVVTNAGGSVNSADAILSVVAAPVAPVSVTLSGTTTVTVGGTVTLTAAVSGNPSPSPTLQWKRNGVVISGAQGTTLSFVATLADNGVGYTCVATNSAGSAASVVASTLTVNPLAPTCAVAASAAGPYDIGQHVTFTATVTGTPTPTLAWTRNGTAIAGATGPVVALTMATGDTTVACTASNGASATGTATVVMRTAVAPAFTVHPASQTVAVGGVAGFSVVVTGTPTPTLQWKRNAMNITGATSASLAWPVATIDGGAEFACVASNGSIITSNPAVLTLALDPPVITTQPSAQLVDDAAVATFSLTAAPADAFQWQRSLDLGTSWSDIAGATATMLSFTADAAANQASRYRCRVSYGSVTVQSAAATLTIRVTPVFTTQPVSLSAALGAVAVFTAEATGAPTVQWQRSDNGTSWTAIPGATHASLAFVATVDDANDQFRCVASSLSPAATVNSNPATLTVGLTLPVFTVQPMAAAVPVGGTLVLSVAVSGSPATAALGRPAVLWQTSPDGAVWTDLGSALSQPIVTATPLVATYRCRASNPAGLVFSDAVQVTVAVEAPYITTAPLPVTTNPGRTAVFTVVAGGTPTLTYQWQRSPDGSTWSDESAATTTILSLSGLTEGTSQVRCLVTNAANTVASASAELTVQVATIAPTVSLSPSTLSVAAGNPISLSATIAGVPTPTVQWFAGTETISGATSASLSVPAATYAWNGRGLRCVVTNTGGTAAAACALTVTATAPVVLAQPTAVSTAAGKPFALASAASGMPGATLTYQWQRNGSDVTGATEAVFARNAASFTLHAGTWRCVIGYAGISGATATTDSVPVQVSLTMFPVIGQLYDIANAMPIDATPGAYGLGDDGLVRWNSVAAAYVPVPALEPLVVGSAYFLTGSASPLLQPGLAPFPPSTAPPLTLVWGDATTPKWNLVTVSLDNTLNIPGLGALLTPVEVADFTLYVRAVWLLDSATGTLKRIGDPTRFIGATIGPIPAGAILWVETLAKPPGAPG